MYYFKHITILALPVFALTIASQMIYAQSPGGRIPTGAIGAQVLGRAQLQADYSVNLYGYFTFVEGISGSIFSGAPSENTAMLTFVADQTAATLITNGGIIQGLEKPMNGIATILSVYYNAGATSRDILNPADFTQGQLIARFQSRAAVVNVSGTSGGTFQASSGLTLVNSDNLSINGQTISFQNLANALNLTLFGPAPSFDSILQGLMNDGNFSIPFAGTAYVVAPQ